MKNLALMAHVTTDAKEGPLLCAAYNLGVEDLHMVGGEEINSEQCYVIFLNGIMIGVHKQPHKFATSFRTLRRRGIVGESVLGSWVGARRPFQAFLVPQRVPHGFTPRS